VARNTNDVYEAVKGVFDADATLIAAGLTPLYRNEAPKDRDPPYCYFTAIGNPVVIRSSGSTWVTPVIKASVFAKLPAEASGLANLVKKAFENNPPRIDAELGHIFLMIVNNEIETKDDRGVWHSMIEFLLSRN